MTKAANTSLDVMLEKSIDVYWNVDGDRDLSDTWTGLNRFTIFDEKPTDGCTWSGKRLTRKQTTFRPDSLWPEMWKDMSDAFLSEEKSKSGPPKKPKLRGIYFIDPADGQKDEVPKADQ